MNQGSHHPLNLAAGEMTQLEAFLHTLTGTVPQ
jgi:hypothetical protein